MLVGLLHPELGSSLLIDSPLPLTFHVGPFFFFSSSSKMVLECLCSPQLHGDTPMVSSLASPLPCCALNLFFTEQPEQQKKIFKQIGCVTLSFLKA